MTALHDTEGGALRNNVGLPIQIRFELALVDAQIKVGVRCEFHRRLDGPNGSRQAECGGHRIDLDVLGCTNVLALTVHKIKSKAIVQIARINPDEEVGP